MKLTFPSFGLHPVALGMTTRTFPVFLSGTEDLRDSMKRSRLLNAFPGSETWIYPEQVHGSEVHPFSETPLQKISPFRMIPKADGVVTPLPGVTLAILTADCLPIFFLVPDPLTIGLVHAGWRGSSASVAQRAVERLRRLSRQSPGKFLVTFGPCIGSCCYQVGEELRSLFGETITGREGSFYLDLVQENRRQLTKAGILEKNISDCSACTFCHPERFYSFRREGEKAGRMLSWIRISGVLS